MKIIILIVSFTMSLFAYTADCEVYPSETINDGNPWVFSITVEKGRGSVLADDVLYLHKKDKTDKSEPYKNTFNRYPEDGRILYENESNDHIQIYLGKLVQDEISFTRIYTNSDIDVGKCKLRSAWDYYDYGTKFLYPMDKQFNIDNGLKALKKSCQLDHYPEACNKVTSYKISKVLLWLIYFSFLITGLYLIHRVYKTYKNQKISKIKRVVLEILGSLVVIGFLIGWYDKAIWRYYYADTERLLLFTFGIFLLPLWHYIIRKIVIKLYIFISNTLKLLTGKAKKSMKETEQLIKRGTTADELLKWLELKEKGIITDEEFEKKKKELMK